MITADAFVEKMSDHLVNFDSRNVVTPELRKAWEQIWEVLDEQIYGTPLDSRWPVVPAELAVGKSLAIKTFTSMMPLAGHPGVLVVVNRQDEADDMAATINAWAGREVAKAYHAKTPDVRRGNLSPLAKFPTLIICHRRLELGGLDKGSDRFAALFSYGGLRRRCVLVDEALEMVYAATVPSARIRELGGRLPGRLHGRHADALDVLDNLVKVMRRQLGSARRLTATDLLAGTGFAPDVACRLLGTLGNAVSTDKSIDSDFKRDFDGLLYAVQHQLDADQYRWQYTDRRTQEGSIHGHRLLALPTGTHGVIFDATGRLNYVYNSRPHEFRMVDVVRARDHSHVEILAARGGRTGKDAMITKAKADAYAKMVLTDVLAALGAQARDRHVLVAVHKKGEAAFQESPLAKRFASLQTCHWNAITGENKWGACDVGVIATLPYWPLPADLSTYMASRERALDDSQLNDADLDELRQVRAMHMAVELTQFVGRLQRGTTASPVTVLLRLPDHQQNIDGDALLGLVLETLKGATTRAWVGASRKTLRPGRPPKERDALTKAVVTHLSTVKGDTVGANALRAAIGSPSTSSWGRYLQQTTEVAGFAVVRPTVSGRGRETVFRRSGTAV